MKRRNKNIFMGVNLNLLIIESTHNCIYIIMYMKFDCSGANVKYTSSNVSPGGEVHWAPAVGVVSVNISLVAHQQLDDG